MERRQHRAGQRAWLQFLGGEDHVATHTADSIHCVGHNDYECFCQILTGFGNSWMEGSVIWPADELRKPRSWKIRSERNVTHTHTHTQLVRAHITRCTILTRGFWRILRGAPPCHLFLSCCLPFELHHITSLSLPLPKTCLIRLPHANI